MKTITHFELADMYDKRRDNVLRTIERNGIPFETTTAKCQEGGRLVNRRVMVMEDTESLHAIFNVRPMCAVEHGALSAIEQLLNIKLERQYKVDTYRIDGYCVETNTAYEIDEPQHFVDGELKQECKDRQAYIEEKLGCSFVRIKV